MTGGHNLAQHRHPLVVGNVAWLIHSNWCEQCPLNHSLTLSGHVLSGGLMLQIASAVLEVCVCVCVCASKPLIVIPPC